MRKSTIGFTITEILVVISVIGILATISAVGMTRYQADARDAQRSSKTAILAEALEKYYDRNGEYPSCNAVSDLDATYVTTTVLPGLEANSLLSPKSAPGDTNSVKCIDLVGAAGETDVFAYVGDGNAACSSVGGLCLSYTLKYKEEATGTIKAIQSRHKVAADAPAAPIVTALTAGVNTTYSWPAATCTGGNIARYQFRYLVDSGYNSGWAANGSNVSAVFSTSSEGYEYILQVQAQCYTTDTMSEWSAAGVASYIRPVQIPGNISFAIHRRTSDILDVSATSTCTNGTYQYYRGDLSWLDATGWWAPNHAGIWLANTFGYYGDTLYLAIRVVPGPAYTGARWQMAADIKCVNYTTGHASASTGRIESAVMLLP